MSPVTQQRALPSSTAAAAPARGALAERLLRRQLGRILRLVDLEVRGEVVQADAFCSDTLTEAKPPAGRDGRLRYEPVTGYSLHEPRVELIHGGLRRALRLGAFCASGGALPVDGLRLRDLARWANHSVSGLNESIGAISSYCNCNCEFCFQKGTRKTDMALSRGQLGLQELETRIRYYSPAEHRGLPPAPRSGREPFANPRCLRILERIHEAAPDELIDRTTNGACLTEDVVARLAKLRPILLCVSLNAGTAGVRRRTMGDRAPNGAETALASPALLRKYEIPFAGSYVPWPSRPLSDLEDAVRLLDRHDALVARICLPSWTAFARQETPFDTEEYWGEILATVQRLRQEVQIPIFPEPHTYELRTMRPVVQGTIKHSPAAQAGIKHGDLILAIEGEAVLTRPEVFRWLTHRFADAAIRSTRFTIQRGDEQIQIEVPHPDDLEALNYPYRYVAERGALRTWAGALGLHLTGGRELTSFVELARIVGEYAGQRVLLFISPLAGPQLYEGMGMLGELAASVNCAQLYVHKLWPRYWGGNVMIGDLWTVNDLVQETRSWSEREGTRPDVVVVPQTFLSAGGRDLLGQSWLEFERALDIELRLLPCRLIGI